jgi:chromosome segregation ATPase
MLPLCSALRRLKDLDAELASRARQCAEAEQRAAAASAAAEAQEQALQRLRDEAAAAEAALEPTCTELRAAEQARAGLEQNGVEVGVSVAGYMGPT